MSEVTLPIELSSSGNYTTSEIGTIFILTSYPKLSLEEKMMWEEDDIFIEDVSILKEAGVIKLEGDHMTINIEKPKKEFWELEEHDGQDNPVYVSPSPYGDDGVPYMWRIRPKLWNMKIIWVNISDPKLRNSNSQECFDSMEEAKAYFEEDNLEILKSIESEVRREGSDKTVDERIDLETSFLKRISNL